MNIDDPSARHQRAPIRPQAVAWMALGWLFFAIGLAGAVLPVLPTTPFMLLALGAFAKGSRRLHAWLFNHPRFGPPLRRWVAHRVIPWHAKAIALAAMTTSLIALSTSTAIPPWGVFVATLILAYGAVFILSRPSRVPEE